MTSWRLAAELILRRYGWAALLAVPVLLAALFLHGVLLPQLEARVAAQEAAVAAAKAELGRPATPPAGDTAEQRLAAFRAVLIPEAALAATLDAVFDEAARQGLTLSQADYKRGADEAGPYRMIHVRLPIKGSYARIRRFADELLQRLPAVAIDEISLRRERIGSGEAEANLRLSIHLAGATP